MDQTPFTPRSRELGDALRTLRKQFARGAEFAESLGWDPSKVSNVERGKVRPSEADLAQYLTACGKDRDCITEFVNQYRQAFNPYFAQQTDKFSTVMFAERGAATITGYSKTALPDLLRIDGYTEMLLQRRGATPDQIETAIRSQRERQRILRSSNRPSCVFYIAETALSAQLDEVRERMDQLELLRRYSRIIRIIPDGKTLPSSTDFTMYAHEKSPTTVVVDCEFAKVFIQDGSAVSQCQAVLATLSEMALGHTDSGALLSRLLGEEYVAVIKAAASEQPTAP